MGSKKRNKRAENATDNGDDSQSVEQVSDESGDEFESFLAWLEEDAVFEGLTVEEAKDAVLKGVQLVKGQLAIANDEEIAEEETPEPEYPGCLDCGGPTRVVSEKPQFLPGGLEKKLFKHRCTVCGTTFWDDDVAEKDEQ